VAALDAMLTLGRRCREALDVAAVILPRCPPLAALQWQGLTLFAHAFYLYTHTHTRLLEYLLRLVVYPHTLAASSSTSCVP